MMSMRSRVRKSRQPLINEDRRSSLQKEVAEDSLDGMLEKVSFKSMSLEERRKEAQKPLFLIRYE
jgi:hypothetical protein